MLTFDYNSNMLPASVTGTDPSTGSGQACAQSIAYDSANRMIRLVRGANKVNTVFTYNPWNVDGGRLQSLTSTQAATGDPLQNLTYGYDPVGNILTITDFLSGPQTQTLRQAQGIAFTYDELDRLTNAAVTGGTDGLYAEGYSYDPVTGNLAGKGGVTYAYDASHAHAVSSLSNGNSYGYDANGNMTSRNVNGQTFTLNYDAENRLVSVSGPSVTAQFTYNGDGQRVKSVVNDETIFFVGEHYELNDTTSEVSKYYFAGASRIAVRKYTVPQSTSLNYLLGDHASTTLSASLGSTSLATDATGNPLVETRYREASRRDKPCPYTRFARVKSAAQQQFLHLRILWLSQINV